MVFPIGYSYQIPKDFNRELIFSDTLQDDDTPISIIAMTHFEMKKKMNSLFQN